MPCPSCPYCQSEQIVYVFTFEGDIWERERLARSGADKVPAFPGCRPPQM